MFTLLITLVNVSISPSADRSTALVDVQRNLTYALENLPTAMAQVVTVQLQRYGIIKALIIFVGYAPNNYYVCIDGCDPEEVDGRMWPEAAPGSTVSTPCPCAEAEGPLPGTVIRQCGGNYSHGARWSDVDNSQCAARSLGQLCALVKVSCTI